MVSPSVTGTSIESSHRVCSLFRRSSVSLRGPCLWLLFFARNADRSHSFLAGRRYRDGCDSRRLPRPHKAAYVTLAAIIRDWPIGSSARKHLIQEQPVGQCTAASGLAAR